MALKSNREGLRKELVDYLGNLIIDENLKKEILDSNDSFLKMDLLWENANPRGLFAEQNIPINNYDRYKFLFITFTPFANEFGVNSLNGSLGTIIIFNDNKWYCFERSSDTIRYRYVKWNNDVSFSNGGSYINGDDNTFGIPVKIYGAR